MILCVDFFGDLQGWLRLFLETFDISVSHTSACTCSTMAIVCARVGHVVQVRASSGFSLNETSWAISTRVRV